MLKENMIGIISDTHDNRSSIKKAVEVFNHAGCSLVVHAGDYIAPFTFMEFEKIEGDFLGVFGNNDGERKGLVKEFSQIGALYQPPHEFTYNGTLFVIMHEPDYLEKFMKKNDIDVILYGHTHERDIRPGKPLVINPGECCSWLTGRSTVALLDLNVMKTEIVDVN